MATTVTLNISGTVASSGWTAIGNNGIQRQKIYTGNTLLESVFFQNPTYNLTGESFVNITWIDTTPPTCDVAYDVEDPTNGDVVASLTGCSELITVTNNPNTTPNTDYLFTGNDSFTFEFVDHVGNTGSAVATVNNIDRTPPTCSVAYSTTNPTNQAVTVSLTSCSETVTPYPQSYTFTGNKNYTFNFTDHVGNMGQVTATVNYIDKILPKITNLTYIPDTATSGNVEVIITLDEPSIIT
ncbi:MAG: hypothetical protein LBD11_06225 [Candidatus Peribacteria bacterium]|nr:hypothetical protein [Candidatus Peribacteria bacterium]